MGVTNYYTWFGSDDPCEMVPAPGMIIRDSKSPHEPVLKDVIRCERGRLATRPIIQ
jgi:hypothetical protein